MRPFGPQAAWLVAPALLALLAILLGTGAQAQTEPPALGEGDWTVRDDTNIEDWGVVRLQGSLRVTDGGSLTLSGTDLYFDNAASGEDGVLVEGGSTLRIVNGSTVGSTRPGVAWTFVVRDGCTLRILDSSIEECGVASFGTRPDWTKVALYVGTSDAVVENTTFIGGLVGLYLLHEDTPPVRNCTFENAYGIVSQGTGVEDCTFRSQTILGLVFHGGTKGYAARCRFENVFGSCLQVGYQYFEPPPGEIVPATATVSDCTFRRSTRAIRVVPTSDATIRDCDIDGMEREGIWAEEGAVVDLGDVRIVNSTMAILSADPSRVEWTVRGGALVRGGNVSLTGNLTLLPGARLALKGFRDLTLLSHAGRPLGITLSGFSRLLLDGGDLRVPDQGRSPHDWTPVDLSGAGGELELRDVGTMNVSFPIDLSTLVAKDSTLPMGSWTAQRAHLEGCRLVAKAGGGPPLLELRPGSDGEESWLIGCILEGIARVQPGGPAWLVVHRGRLVSLDFVHGLQEMLDAGSLRVGGGVGEATVEVMWELQANVHWQNQVAIEGASVTLIDATGDGTTVGVTGPNGWTSPFRVTTEVASGNGDVTLMTPLTFGANVSGLAGTVRVEAITSPVLVQIEIKDLVPPRMVVDQGLSVATNRSVLTITGFVFDEHSGVAFLESALLPRDYRKVLIDPRTDRFEATYELEEGFSEVSLRVYDTVGNRRSVTVEVLFRRTPPEVLITSPEDGSWHNARLAYVEGLTEANATVEAGGRTTRADLGTFRIVVELREGSNLVVLNVTSVTGNRNATHVTLYLDTVPPPLTLTNPPTLRFETRFSTVEVRGSTEVGAQVLINNVPIDVSPEGTFRNNLLLDEGFKRAFVTARDRAGNQVTEELELFLDSLPPELFVLVDGLDAERYTGDGLLRTSSSSVTLLVKTDRNTTLEVDGVGLDLNDSTEVTLVHRLSEGLQGIVIVATDSAGNSVQLGPVNIDVDRTPPELSLAPTIPSTTEEALLSLVGTTEPNVTITVNGALVPVDSRGRFVRNFLLSEGENRLLVVARDLYGQNTTLVREVDMVPSEPSPAGGPDSRLPWLLGVTVALLVIEVVAIELWYWRRSRRQPGD